MRRLLLASMLAFGLLTMSSCSDENTNPNGPTICPVGSGVRIAYTAPDDTAVWHVQASTGRQILGAGFDPNAAFMSDACVKAPVLDLEKMAERVVVISNPTSSYGSIASADAAGILSSLASSTQVLDDGETAPLCAGTFKDDELFQRDIDRSSMFSFAYALNEYSYYTLNVSVPLSEVLRHPEDYLTDAFIADLDQLSEEDLIAKYGTHVLRCVTTGMGIRTLSRTAVLDEEGEDASNWKREVADHYGWWARRQLGLPTAIMVSQDLYEGKYCGGRTSVTFVGGDASLLADNPREGFDAWLRKGCTQDNAALLRIPEAPIPLNKLVSDETKAFALRNAIQKHLAANKLTSVDTKLLVQTWAGGFYRYTTTYDNTRDGGVCGIFTEKKNGMVPLYAYSRQDCFVVFTEETENVSQLLSTDNTSNAKQLLGYIYATEQPGTVPLYVATANGTVQTYCTLDDRPTYGEQGAWTKTGILGYVLPPTR